MLLYLRQNSTPVSNTGPRYCTYSIMILLLSLLLVIYDTGTRRSSMANESTRKVSAFSYNIDALFEHVDAIWSSKCKDAQKYRALLLALPTYFVILLHGLPTPSEIDKRYEETKAALLMAISKPKQVYLAEL